LPEKL
jgi:hypothetical protein